MVRTQKNRNGKDRKKDGGYNGQIFLKQTFEVYKTWYSLPGIWKGLNEKKLVDMGIVDQVMIELLRIRTQTEFCARFNVHKDTVTKWNKLIDELEIDPLDEARKWASRLTKNVVAAHYRKAVKRFDPMTGESWYKVISGWNEKKEIEHSGKLSLLDLSKKIADEKDKHKERGGDGREDID